MPNLTVNMNEVKNLQTSGTPLSMYGQSNHSRWGLIASQTASMETTKTEAAKVLETGGEFLNASMLILEEMEGTKSRL